MQQQALNSFQITTGTIYLMGGSFILGSLFTLLLLVLLDFMRSLKSDKDNKGESPDGGR